MSNPNIIVIGASAGGIEALQVIARGLPCDLPAAVFVVVHMGAGLNGNSLLPEILGRSGPLPATTAIDGERIRQSHIYVARPDFHLLLEPGRMRVVDGPRENLTRPAINPLFRSAAAVYGQRVVGVILTGQLDDGVAGLAEIKRRGGLTIIQNPATALYPSMPQQAVRYIEADHVANLGDIPAILAVLAANDRAATEVVESMSRNATNLTCPECQGPIWEERQGRILEYRCRVGHGFSPLTFLQEHRARVERSLWESVVSLEEAADLSEQFVDELGAEATEDAKQKREQAGAIRTFLDKSKRRPPV